MVRVSVHIDAASFGRKFNKMLDSPKFKQNAYDVMNETYERARERLFEEFNSSPITQEIENGPYPEEGDNNKSGLLDGYGDLYSFIGFHADQENPIAKLREYLEGEHTIKMEQTVRRGNKWYFRISMPSKSEIAAQTPMPWEEGNSWVEGIEEEGISNLSHYINKAWETSYSTMGIQIPYVYRPVNMHTSPYLLGMLKEFKNEFE